MRTVFAGPRTAVLLVCCAIAGCSGPSPAEVEAQRARANAEWNAQAAESERARQAEENRLVNEEIAAHARREETDQRAEAERREAAREGERSRLLKMVAAKFPDPESIGFANVRWNDANTALCGNLTSRAADNSWSEPVAFVASGDDAQLDSAAAGDHERFLAAAQDASCPP